MEPFTRAIQVTFEPVKVSPNSTHTSLIATILIDCKFQNNLFHFRPCQSVLFVKLNIFLALLFFFKS